MFWNKYVYVNTLKGHHHLWFKQFLNVLSTEGDYFSENLIVLIFNQKFLFKNFVLVYIFLDMRHFCNSQKNKKGILEKSSWVYHWCIW